MNSVIKTIGIRPYWQGGAVPSTAFVTTDLLQLTLGELTDEEVLVENQTLPELFDLMVEFQPIRSSLNPTVSCDNKSYSVYSNKLNDFSVSEMVCVSQGLCRIQGIVQKVPVSGIWLTTVKFQTLQEDHVVTNPSQEIPLGGFWREGCELIDIKQYHVAFYQMDRDIHYDLHPKNSFEDHICDRKLLLKIPQEDDANNPIIYESVDCQRHGSKRAWITFQKQS